MVDGTGGLAVRRRPLGLVAVGLLLTVVLAACNSTTRLAKDQQTTGVSASAGGGGAADTGAGSGAGSGSGSGPGTGTGSGSGGSGAASGLGSVSGPGSGSGAGLSGGGPSGPSASGGGPAPGAGSVTGSLSPNLKIGVVLMNYGAVGSTFGVKGLSTGSTKAQAQAVVDALNAQGGIAGHKIVPVYVTVDITNGTYSGQAQATCATLTEDNPVFAVVGASIDIFTLAACLGQHHTPLIPSPWVAASIGFMDDQAARQYSPYLYWPNLFNPAGYSVAVDKWVSDGFLTPASRIGIMRADQPPQQRVDDNVVRPRLAAHGLKVTDEVAVQVNNSVSDLGGPSAQASNAVLRFRSEGVDRVLWIPEGTGGEAFFFMPEAENQGYHPKYGVTSFLAPYFLEANEPATQLAGSEGIGWQPTVDTDPQHDPGPTPGRAACADIMHRAGQAFADRGVENAAYSFCESFFFLRAALAGTTSPTPAALQAGSDALGATFPSVLTFGERFGPGRLAPVSAVRQLRFDNGCACYQYFGPVLNAG